MSLRRVSSLGILGLRRSWHPIPIVQFSHSSFSTINVPPPASEPPIEQSSIKDRLKKFFKQYGKLGVGVYLGVSVFTFSSAYLALRSGLDVPGLLIKLGVPEKEWMKNAGTFAFAYALYKLALPIRLFVTVGLTGFIARRLRWYHPIDPKHK